jgi:hypothetical protein
MLRGLELVRWFDEEYGLEMRSGKALSWTLDGFWNFMA